MHNVAATARHFFGHVCFRPQKSESKIGAGFRPRVSSALYRRSALKVFIAGVTPFITCFFYLSGHLKVFYIVEFLQIS